LSEGSDFCQKCGSKITDINSKSTKSSSTKLPETVISKNEKLEKILWIAGGISCLLLTPVGIILIIIAFVIRHRNGKDVMLPGGITSTVVGFFIAIRLCKEITCNY
jgi:uncharacterized membrane protein